jgi:hypothetical protein
MKQRKHHHKRQDEPQTITKAVTHIRLEAANTGKLAAPDDLAPVYLPLCQHYVTLFCTEEQPDKFRAPCIVTPLSERWHRVAIQQAVGIAQSWRTNRAQAYQDYVDELLDYLGQQAEGNLDPQAEEPTWREWNIPTLRKSKLCCYSDTRRGSSNTVGRRTRRPPGSFVNGRRSRRGIVACKTCLYF